MQLPEKDKLCPRCGAKAILVLDVFETLPRLDVLGYPQYHCTRCATLFTALDLPPTNDTTHQKEHDNGNNWH